MVVVVVVGVMREVLGILGFSCEDFLWGGVVGKSWSYGVCVYFCVEYVWGGEGSVRVVVSRCDWYIGYFESRISVFEFLVYFCVWVF